MKVSILIPAYNEARTCRVLLERVVKANTAGCDREIIVIESGSSDGTRSIIQEYESRGLIRAIYERRPLGKGHAIREGLKAAIGEIILIQDADLEYSVEDYPDLLEPLLQNRTDFVLGSRHLGQGSWKIRRFINEGLDAFIMNLGTLSFTWLFNLLYGVRLTDPATMFKVFRRSSLNGIPLRSRWFELDWEIVAKLVRGGHIPLEVPVSYVSRSFREGKKIRFWRDGMMGLWAILRFRFLT